MPAPFPGLSWRVLFILHVFRKEWTVQAFNRDTSSHLALCLHMMLEFKFELQFVSFLSKRTQTLKRSKKAFCLLLAPSLLVKKHFSVRHLTYSSLCQHSDGHFIQLTSLFLYCLYWQNSLYLVPHIWVQKTFVQQTYGLHSVWST